MLFLSFLQYPGFTSEFQCCFSPTTRLTLRRAGDLSRGHQNTQNTLKRKKQTDKTLSISELFRKTSSRNTGKKDVGRGVIVTLHSIPAGVGQLHNTLYQTDPTHTRQNYFHSTTSEHSQRRFSAFLPLPRALHLSSCIQKRRIVKYPNQLWSSEYTGTRQKRLYHFPLIAICLVSILYHECRGEGIAQSV